MDRCPASLCRRNHLKQTSRVAIDTAPNMHKHRHLVARGDREDHIALGIIHCPRHVIEQESDAQATRIQLHLEHALHLLALGDGGGLSKCAARHIELACRGQRFQRIGVDDLHADPGVPDRGSEVRERRIAQLLTKTRNGKSTRL